MPQMATITVVDGVSNANQDFTAAAPSAGDRIPAIWRSSQTGTISKLGQQPLFTMLTRDNGKKTARHMSFTFRWPVIFQDSSSGREYVDAVIPFTVEATIPTNVDAATISNAYKQFAGLLSSSLVKSAVEAGYAPT